MYTLQYIYRVHTLAKKKKMNLHMYVMAIIVPLAKDI